ncbi:MAG: RNA polymerase factor sigma-54 [Pseudomonadota bacterium]
MSIGLRLDLRQTQQLVMTPQLQQAIKLLQMSHVELQGFIGSEIEKNPLLELESASEPEQVESAANAETEAAETLTAEPSIEELDARQNDLSLLGETYDSGVHNLHDTTPSDGPSPFQRTGPVNAPVGNDTESRPLEERISGRTSLRDHLLGQIGQISAEPGVSALARALVDELDENGYLRSALDDVAERFSVSDLTCRRALELLQSCEPTGVGARSLGECLALQLRERNRFDPVIAKLLENLPLLADGKLQKLARLCATGEDEIREMVRELRDLDPHPCSGFDTEEPETLIPDLLLKPMDWGGWSVELNPETLPRVLIDKTYMAHIGNGCDETRKYLTECHSSASWLVRSLDQRSRTIVTIASEIVRQQEGFFRDGIHGLKPMTLRDVADAVGMHESTASRVTANKYIATERGIFELRFFFTNAVAGSGGDVAAEAVRHRIQAMVDAEPPNGVLSDDAIVSALQNDGISIARRTVAKYRKSLRIPSSSQRRRMKAAKL